MQIIRFECLTIDISFDLCLISLIKQIDTYFSVHITFFSPSSFFFYQKREQNMKENDQLFKVKNHDKKFVLVLNLLFMLLIVLHIILNIG